MNDMSQVQMMILRMMKILRRAQCELVVVDLVQRKFCDLFCVTHNAINITIAYISKVAIDQSVRLGYSNTIEQL